MTKKGKKALATWKVLGSLIQVARIALTLAWLWLHNN